MDNTVDDSAIAFSPRQYSLTQPSSTICCDNIIVGIVPLPCSAALCYANRKMNDSSFLFVYQEVSDGNEVKLHISKQYLSQVPTVR